MDNRSYSPAGPKLSRSDRFAVAIVVFYAIVAAVVVYGGIVGHAIYVGLISAGFLAVYAAGPLAAVLWAAFMTHRFFRRKNQGSLIRSGVKSAVVIFGTIGLAIWTFGSIPPNGRAVSAGYWFRARLKVDVEEVRSWAAGQEPSTDRFEPIGRDQWPETLRRVSLGGGVVTCDPKTRTVVFYEGGQYVRWGVTIARPGTEPPDDRCAVSLADGAWVWAE